MKDFLHMDGYALYVWTSYALAFVILVINVLWPISKRRRVQSDIAMRVRRESKNDSAN